MYRLILQCNILTTRDIIISQLYLAVQHILVVELRTSASHTDFSRCSHIVYVASPVAHGSTCRNRSAKSPGPHVSSISFSQTLALDNWITIAGAHQAAGALLKQWAFALPPLAVLPYALLPGWSLGKQRGKAEEELEGYEEEEEGVEDVEFFSRWFDSVKRKRLAKMKRHKWKKRRREQRQAVKKDYK